MTMRQTYMSSLCGVLVLITSCAHPETWTRPYLDGVTIELQGRVHYMPPQVGPGGEAPHGGYFVNGLQLEGDDFANYDGQYVRVKGRRSTVRWGRVERPFGATASVIVDTIERVR